jgi:hypothetical protein
MREPITSTLPLLVLFVALGTPAVMNPEGTRILLLYCMCMVVATKCIHGFYSIMQDSCYTYMHAYTIVTVGCSASISSV